MDPDTHPFPVSACAEGIRHVRHRARVCFLSFFVAAAFLTRIRSSAMTVVGGNEGESPGKTNRQAVALETEAADVEPFLLCFAFVFSLPLCRRFPLAAECSSQKGERRCVVVVTHQG